jgi:hypothetical protein
MHSIDGQEAHQRAAREPQKKLRADNDREPLVSAAREKVQPKFGASQGRISILACLISCLPDSSSSRVADRCARDQRLYGSAVIPES